MDILTHGVSLLMVDIMQALAKCPYAAIIDYISKQPKNTLGIKDVEVSHVWTDNPDDAKLVAKVAEIENIVEDQKM